jgi:hypothetical protein
MNIVSYKIAYKLLNKRKDNSLGPLFINKKQRIPIGILLKAEPHKTKGFAFRPGWHCTSNPIAPHLKMNNRVWTKVIISDFEEIKRPQNQGGIWYIANYMQILEIL